MPLISAARFMWNSSSKILRYSTTTLNASSFSGESSKVKSKINKKTIVAKDKNEQEIEDNNDESDQFGTLDTDLIFQNEQKRDADEHLDDHDGYEEYKAKRSDIFRPKPVDYLRKMNALVRQNQLQSALSLLDDEMKRECVKPREKHFRVLIHACGQAGYTRKAFLLYREYQARNFPWNYGIISDLFNSCANSPDPDDALGRTSRLRHALKIKARGSLPKVVYHTMIKAFGRCGDLQSAFSCVDEMKEKKVPIDSGTYNHLLQGCVSDKQSGFRHAIFVWRRMLKAKMNPEPNLVHLMLRSALECGVGDKDFAYDLMLECMSVKEARTHRQKLIEGGKKENAVKNQLSFKNIAGSELALVENNGAKLILSETKPKMPNILEKKPNFDNVASLGNLDRPQDRLMLLGGLDGVIRYVKKEEKLKLDIKLFTYLLDLIEKNPESESKLLQFMEENGVLPDTIFLNKLILVRALRKDYQGGKEVLEVFNKHGLSVDIVTFGSLAQCCRTHASSLELIRSMESSGYHPNMEIITALAKNAGIRLSLGTMVYLLRLTEEEQLKPTPKLLEILETFRNRFRKKILNAERNPNENVFHPVKVEMESDFKLLRTFDEKYAEFLKNNLVELPSHPWVQFYTEKDKGRTVEKM